MRRIYSPRTSDKSAGAFTLVELLVVLGVIAILAGMIFPVFARVREKGRATACVSNLHQLYEAFSMYATDYNGFLPPYQNHMATWYSERFIPVPAHGDLLVAALAPYTKSAEIWFCPSDYFAHTPSTEGYIDHRYTSYRTLPDMGFGPISGDTATIDGTTFDSKKDPAILGLLRDNLWPFNESNPMKPLYSHNMVLNYVFFDGHVKGIPWERCPR